MGAEYSIVIPVYNGEGSIKPLIEEIVKTMTGIGKPFEILFVNDGSDDNSLAAIERLSAKYPQISPVVTLPRSGQTYALRQGLDHANGNIIITMDADLQNDPADIPQMLKKMDENYDCVCGWRRSRQDTKLKAGLSKFGNICQRAVSGLRIHDISCTLRAYKRKCISKIALNWEGQHRFIPLSLSLQGFKVGEIESHHRRRRFGMTKYSHKRVFRVVLDFFRVMINRGQK